MEGALTEFEPFGTTSLYDATARPRRHVAARSASRKAIIVLTDGIDTSSAMTPREVSGLASSIDVPVFIVATVPPVDQRARTEGVRAAHRKPPICATWQTGRVDRFVFATTFGETVTAATTSWTRSAQQYLLAIAAADAREWRRLDVRVKRPSAIVKARSGYFGG